MRSKPVNRAFTLIEVLISLAIVATIMTMVYGSYAATARTIDLQGSRTACAERAQLALRLIARQIRGAYLPASGRRPHTGRRALTERAEPAPPLSVAFEGDASDARGHVLSFTTTGGFASSADRPAGLSNIRYRYDARAQVLIVSSESHATGEAEATATAQWRPMLQRVETLDLEFHDGRKWQRRWDSQEQRSLPRAVRIGLTILDESGRQRRFATSVPVVCHRMETASQQRRTAARP